MGASAPSKFDYIYPPGDVAAVMYGKNQDRLYLFGGSTCTWLGVFSACFLLRQRTALVLTAPLLLVCFAKGAHMLNDELWRRETMPLVALTGGEGGRRGAKLQAVITLHRSRDRSSP